MSVSAGSWGLDLGTSDCKECGEHLHSISTRHRDGTVTWELVCWNRACPAGPGGLMTLRQIQKTTGGVASRTKFWDATQFHETSQGKPTQNEENVTAVARAFVDGANRQYETKFYGIELPSDAPEREHAYDCIVLSRRHDDLRLQVTRALPSIHYSRQAVQDGRECADSSENAAGWLRQAIERKSSRAAADIALVIDGVDFAPIGIFCDTSVIAKHAQFLRAQAWHSIWIAGVFGLRCLKAPLRKLTLSFALSRSLRRMRSERVSNMSRTVVFEPAFATALPLSPMGG